MANVSMGASGIISSTIPDPRSPIPDPRSPKTPPITVAIPAYNGERFIGEAVRSVLEQTHGDLLLVISDDGSTDRTVEIVEGFRDPRLRIERNPQRIGLAANWNRCIELCHSAYCCVFHQDDVMRPTNLAAKLTALEARPDAGFVYSAIDVIDAEGREIPAGVIGRDTLSAAPRRFAAGEFLAVLAGANVVRAASVVARRRCYTKLGAFDESLGYVVDWDMWLRIAARWGVVWLPDPLVRIRWHAGSETARLKAGTADLEEYERLLQKIFDPANLYGAAPAARRAGAYRRLARAYLNRGYEALRFGREAERARTCIERAVRLDRRMLGVILGDPRLAGLIAGLYLAPSLLLAALRRREPG